jgi:hypothetical protein
VISNARGRRVLVAAANASAEGADCRLRWWDGRELSVANAACVGLNIMHAESRRLACCLPPSVDIVRRKEHKCLLALPPLKTLHSRKTIPTCPAALLPPGNSNHGYRIQGALQPGRQLPAPLPARQEGGRRCGPESQPERCCCVAPAPLPPRRSMAADQIRPLTPSARSRRSQCVRQAPRCPGHHLRDGAGCHQPGRGTGVFRRRQAASPGQR